MYTRIKPDNKLTIMRLLLISNSTNPGEPYLDYPEIYVVGLREGTMLLVDNSDINLTGPRKARIF
jgi:hypothetical protein